MKKIKLVIILSSINLAVFISLMEGVDAACGYNVPGT